MKALENRTIFSSCQHDREKMLQIHRERLKCIRNVIDTRRATTPNSARCSSPSKKAMTKQANHERIVKDNLLLAHKIFNIMEGNSDITDKINDNRHIDNHPGTMNFKARLAEAKRVHERNMLLASRLDTVQPYYKVSDLRVIRATKKRVATPHNAAKKSKFARELGLVLKADRHVDGFGELTHRSAGHADSFGHNTRLPSIDPEMQSQSARKADYGQEPESRGDNQRGRPNNVLLEYTKIQDGRVLDVAVLKEPFRDRYAIFGIDVDDGQRYELRITSEEVSSILDGDMLVTSVDNVEVWMALLNKVVLQKVGFFARLPFSSEEVDNVSSHSNNNSTSRGGSPPKSAPISPRTEEDIAARYALNFSNTSGTPGLVPSAPAVSRPSTERPASRSNTGAGTTSAAGAIRSRHLKSAGIGNTTGSANSRGNGSRPARAASQQENESPAAVDPILSLFAEAGLVDDFARTQIATPGFLDNATSADVTLVEVNADFPDAPSEADATKFFDNDPVEEPPSGDSPRTKDTKKRPGSQQRTSLKSGGGTRSNAQRAAAVRRSSIEKEQVRNAKPAPAVATATGSAAVHDTSTAPTQHKTRAAGDSKGPTNRPSVHKNAPAVAKTATRDATAPTPALVPKPPAAKPTGAAQPETKAEKPVSVSAKAGPLSPKAPAAAPSSARPGSKVGSAKILTQSTVSAKAAAVPAQSPPPSQKNSTPAAAVVSATMTTSTAADASASGVPACVPATAMATAQEQAKEVALSCVSSAVDLALASVVRSRSNLSLQQNSAKLTSTKEGASNEVEAASSVEAKVTTDEPSMLLNEPSQVTNKSVLGEASASQGYSTDFEAASSS